MRHIFPTVLTSCKAWKENAFRVTLNKRMRGKLSYALAWERYQSHASVCSIRIIRHSPIRINWKGKLAISSTRGNLSSSRRNNHILRHEKGILRARSVVPNYLHENRWRPLHLHFAGDEEDPFAKRSGVSYLAHIAPASYTRLLL